MEAVESVARGSLTVETVDLSEDYLKPAGELAERRAAFSAHRWARIPSDALR